VSTLSPELPTKDRLIQSAVALLAQHGSLASVSLRAVAADAGVSPTAVYRHYDDHNDLLEASLTWCWKEFDEAINVATEGVTDPYERFRRQGRAYVSFALARNGVYRVLFSGTAQANGAVAQTSADVFAKLVDVVGEVLMANSDDRDPFLVATQVFSWIHGIADLRCGNDQFPWPPIEDQLEALTETLRLTRRD
jgi:AcrR family transcriptional regulator